MRDILILSAGAACGAAAFALVSRRRAAARASRALAPTSAEVTADPMTTAGARGRLRPGRGRGRVVPRRHARHVRGPARPPARVRGLPPMAERGCRGSASRRAVEPAACGSAPPRARSARNGSERRVGGAPPRRSDGNRVGDYTLKRACPSGRRRLDTRRRVEGERSGRAAPRPGRVSLRGRQGTLRAAAGALGALRGPYALYASSWGRRSRRARFRASLRHRRAPDARRPPSFRRRAPPRGVARGAPRAGAAARVAARALAEPGARPRARRRGARERARESRALHAAAVRCVAARRERDELSTCSPSRRSASSATSECSRRRQRAVPHGHSPEERRGARLHPRSARPAGTAPRPASASGPPGRRPRARSRRGRRARRGGGGGGRRGPGRGRALARRVRGRGRRRQAPPRRAGAAARRARRPRRPRPRGARRGAARRAARRRRRSGCQRLLAEEERAAARAHRAGDAAAVLGELEVRQRSALATRARTARRG